MRGGLILLAILAAALLAGTNDMHDAEAQERVNAEIVASAAAWAVTR